MSSNGHIFECRVLGSSNSLLILTQPWGWLKDEVTAKLVLPQKLQFSSYSTEDNKHRIFFLIYNTNVTPVAILLINPIEMLGGGRLRLCLGQNFVSAFHFMDLTFLNIDDNENIYLTENMDSLVIKAMYSTYRSKLSHFKNNPVCF